MVIDSTPPPMAASTPSLITMWAAWTMACSPELQNRLTVRPAVVTGNPARSAATRATLWPCGPCGWPQPRITSSMVSGSSAGTFFSASTMQCAARSSGRVMLNDPRWDLASGVRALDTMTASLTASLICISFYMRIIRFTEVAHAPHHHARAARRQWNRGHRTHGAARAAAGHDDCRARLPRLPDSGAEEGRAVPVRFGAAVRLVLHAGATPRADAE